MLLNSYMVRLVAIAFCFLLMLPSAKADDAANARALLALAAAQREREQSAVKASELPTKATNPGCDCPECRCKVCLCGYLARADRVELAESFPEDTYWEKSKVAAKNNRLLLTTVGHRLPYPVQGAVNSHVRELPGFPSKCTIWFAPKGDWIETKPEWIVESEDVEVIESVRPKKVMQCDGERCTPTYWPSLRSVPTRFPVTLQSGCASGSCGMPSFGVPFFGGSCGGGGCGMGGCSSGSCGMPSFGFPIMGGCGGGSCGGGGCSSGRCR